METQQCYMCNGPIKENKCIICNYEEPQETVDMEIDITSTKNKLDNNEDFILLDIRREDEFALAKINKATLIPMHEIYKRLDEIPKDKEIITYCHTGVRSLHAARYLKQQGYRNVKSMRGGISAWSIYIDQTVPQY